MKSLLKKYQTIRNTIIGTALVVFVFRAVPGVGAEWVGLKLIF